MSTWEYSGLCLLVLMSLVLHFVIIEQPNQLVFDEQHYIKDARYIIENHTTQRIEHPPLGKLFITSGILLFGDNPIGWRFFSILFGTTSLVLFYLVCRKLTMTKVASLLATYLLALENLSFVQASVAMLDVFTVTFMLGAFLLYLQGWYEFSAILVGLSALAKLNGALVLPVIALHWFFTGRRTPVYFFASMLLAPISFVLLLPLFNYGIERNFSNPIVQIYNMLTLSGSLTFANAAIETASRPWKWILRPELMFYWYEPHYIGVISYTIWALIIPAVIYMLFRAIKGNSASLFGLSWFVSTYLLWIPASLITNRISFVYYFYPTIGAIAIGIGLGLTQLIDIWRSQKSGWRWLVMVAVSGYLVAHAVIFVILSPVFS